MNSRNVKERYNRRRERIKSPVGPEKCFLGSYYITHGIVCEFSYCNQLALLEEIHWMKRIALQSPWNQLCMCSIWGMCGYIHLDFRKEITTGYTDRRIITYGFYSKSEDLMHIVPKVYTYFIQNATKPLFCYRGWT